MPVETTELNEYAVLWALSSYDNNGEATVSAGVELKVRWTDAESQSATARGTPIAADATAVVDCDIALDSIMRLGRLSAVPTPPTDLYEVVSMRKTPDLKARTYRRIVSLRRYKDALPTIV